MKCHVSAHLRNGCIQEIRHATCVKGRYAHEVLYHPDRLKYPMKRTGPRAGGGWQRISWDEALDTMAERFATTRAKWGPEAICAITGCLHKENAATASLLFGYLLGTPNVLDANHLCSTNDFLAQMVTLGDVISNDVNVDYQRSRCILVWGANPPQTRLPQARDIRRAQRAGARLIVVDPRPTEMARQADLWLRLRPGSDAALALAMIHVILQEGLYDRAFVEEWCYGLTELKKRATEYPPQRAAELCWLPTNQIVQAARLFATIKPACLHTRLGSGAQQVNSTQTARATACLMALAGNIDVPGGNLLSNDLGGFKTIFKMRNVLRLPPEKERGRFGAHEFPLQCGSRETARWRFNAHTPSGIKTMLAGGVRAFFVCGNNTVVQEANSREVWQALQKLDFLVVADLFLTPTAELADILLPAAHWLETEGVSNSYTGDYNRIMATQKVVEPVGEARDDREIVLALARRMGLPCPWKTAEELNDLRLTEVGLRFQDLKARPEHAVVFPVEHRKYTKRGFATPTGKVELYSTILAEHGYDPLPFHQEPPQSPLSTPELARQYPLILIQSRHIAYESSEYRQVASLRRLVPEPELELNPDTAAAQGIQEGRMACLQTPLLPWWVRARARFLPGLHPRVVSLLHGWWFPEQAGPEHGCLEANANAILSNNPPYDPINGNYQVRAVLCRIRKED
jgi:anaerobic selenocysteine-containing dehydrogenase